MQDSVLADLEFPFFLRPVLLSESEGVEKPAAEIFLRALRQVNSELEPSSPSIMPDECVHVGDELEWYVLDLFSLSYFHLS